MSRTKVVLLAVTLLLAGTLGAYLTSGRLAAPPPTCTQYYTGEGTRSQLLEQATGPRSIFSLPGPSRYPNGVAVALDGSVWFGEESIPAFAHLFTNGTLLEYPWPGTYPPPSTSYTCGYRTQIWSVALWNGSVWAPDAAGNQLVGYNPRTNSFEFVKMGTPSAFPYFVGPGPDGALWFTELSAPAIGRLDANGSVRTFPLPTGMSGTPTQINFLNSSFGVYTDAGIAGENNGGIFSFNPAHPDFIRLGTPRPLGGLTGLALQSSGLWISEHGPSYVDYLDYHTGAWTDYPTSTVSYSKTTLPYFVVSSGDLVWFNEHYGDRIAQIDKQNNSMIEYSLSTPPAGNLSDISSALTIAESGNGVWFTQISRNAVGFMNFSLPSPFAIFPISSTALTLKQGGSAETSFRVVGTSSSTLHLAYSDSEGQTGEPFNLTASAPSQSVAPGDEVPVTFSASADAPLGTYVFDVSVSDGSTISTIFVSITVES